MPTTTPRGRRKAPAIVTTPAPDRGHIITPPPADWGAWGDRYILIVNGACMEPLVADGALAIFDPAVPYAPGDIVVLHWRAEFIKPGGATSVIKQLLQEPPPWVRFPYNPSPTTEVVAALGLAMLNPRKRGWVRCSRIAAIHKMIGIADAAHGAGGAA
jgi:hypothetical protein